MDGDTKYNHQDLDSDGDGCSDAKEGTVTPSAPLATVGTYTSAQYPLASFVDTNSDGLYDGAAQTTYNQYSTNSILNVCLDTDGDGLGDLADLDDDNDGILDTVELASCGFNPNTAAYKSTIIATSGASTSGSPQLLLNSLETNQFYYNTQTLSNTNIVTFQFPAAVSISGIEISAGGNFLNTGSSVIVQGSNNGTTWTDLTAPYSPAGVSTSTYGLTANGTQKFPITNNTAAYSYYRILGVSGGLSNSPYVYEAYFSQVTAIFCDTDGDGISNQLDLDSDGDGCSDAKEAAVTSTNGTLATVGTLSNARYNFTAGSSVDANNDGWLDATTQTTYNLYSLSKPLNVCADTDGDGISDLVDIDDDNDGIVDAVESPSCFYTSAEASVLKSVSTPLANDDGVNVDLPFMRDGVTTTVPANDNVITAGAATNGSVVYNIEYPAKVKLTNIIQYGSGAWGASATGRIEASNDGSNWTSLMSAATAATGATNTFTVNQNPGFYRYYRLVKAAGTTTPSFTTYEVAGTVDATGYVPSANPKPTCTVDTDGDGKYNHQDLDSDGDLCSDAKEATVTPAASLVADGTLANAKFSFVSPTNDTNNDGLYDGAAQTTYSPYATNKVLNVCADTDGDGINDLADLDDDNDGILDTIELASCGFNPNAAAYKSTIIATSGAGTSGSPQLLLDGAEASLFYYTGQTMSNTNIATFQFPSAVTIKGIEIAAGSAFVVAGSSVKVQGSTDGTSWTDLTTPFSPGATSTSTYGLATAGTQKFPFTDNISSYSYYRILGISGNLSSSPYVYEAYFSPVTAIFCDTDGDGISNQLDLDSDGDGCSDAKEAAVSPSAPLVAVGALQNAQYPTSTFVDANGDGWYDGVTQTSYSTFANTAVFNLCSDLDGDGILDLVDIDDDNDGITDYVELSSCNLSLNSAGRKALMTSTSEIPPGAFTAAKLVDNNEGNDYYFTAGSSIVNKAVAQFDLGSNYYLNGFEISTNSASFFNTGATFKIQASYDGNSWTDLTSSTTAVTGTLTAGTYDTSVANTYKFPFTSNSPYRFYRVYGLSGTISGSPYVREVYFSTATPAFCDTDGDGISNDKDLDSDGDGCSDAKEANVSPAASLVTSGSLSNAKFNFVSPTNDANSDGLYDGATQTTYTQYSLNGAINMCTDTDGDGVVDAIDIDDDNDGILDTIESPLCAAFTNGSMETYTSCPNLSVGGTIDYATGWKTFGGVSSSYGQLMVNNPPDCISNKPAASWDPSTALTAGSNGKNWLGGHNGEDFQNTLNTPIQPGTYTLTFDGGNVINSPYVGNSQSITIYGLKSTDADFATPASQVIGTTTINNIISSSNQVWKKYTVTLNVTQAYDRLHFVLGTFQNFTPSTYSYADNFILSCNYNNDIDGDGITNDKDLDSDNDGCLDAIEGAANITNADLVAAGGTATTGPGSTAPNYNLCAGSTCVNAQGLPQFATLPSGYSNTTGQALGDSQNAAVAVCTPICTAPVINTQPLASQTVGQNGTPTNLTVSATGTSLTYQWYSNTTNSNVGGTLISGANTASYTPATATLGTNYYYVVVSSLSCKTTSNVSTVIVNLSSACYKPGIADAGNTYPTKHGITALGRAGEDNSNWPMVRQSAWTVLEAKTKGFVINRVKFNASNLPVADDGVTRVIMDPVEGMLVYDTINHCLKMYTSTDNGSTYGWYCLTNQACPD